MPGPTKYPATRHNHPPIYTSQTIWQTCITDRDKDYTSFIGCCWIFSAPWIKIEIKPAKNTSLSQLIDQHVSLGCWLLSIYFISLMQCNTCIIRFTRWASFRLQAAARAPATLHCSLRPCPPRMTLLWARHQFGKFNPAFSLQTQILSVWFLHSS